MILLKSIGQALLVVAGIVLVCAVFAYDLLPTWILLAASGVALFCLFVLNFYQFNLRK